MGIAASRGLMKPIKPWDYKAVLGERFLLRVLKAETAKEICRLQFTRQCAAIQYLERDAQAEVFKHHFDASQKLLMDFLRLAQPWVDWEKAVDDADHDDAVRDKNTWERTFGDLDDPEVQKDIERLAAKLVSDESME